MLLLTVILFIIFYSYSSWIYYYYDRVPLLFNNSLIAPLALPQEEVIYFTDFDTSSGYCRKWSKEVILRACLLWNISNHGYIKTYKR